MNRDMLGFGANPPKIIWPNDARLALNFVVNYEEGAELTPVNKDKMAEYYGGEFPLQPKPEGQRHLTMESLYEYGSRAGIWRLIRLFDSFDIPLTFFVTGLALTMSDEFSSYLKKSKHDIAGHGWRWIDYSRLSLSTEKKHIQQTISTIENLTDKTVRGWYTGRNSERTRNIIRQQTNIIYDSDSYADDIPYFLDSHLVIPYTLDCNDFRYTTTPGFNHGDDFFFHLKNTFDYYYSEQRTAVMTIALHPRISGRPGRTMALKRFIDYILPYENIWITHRESIADFYKKIKV